VGDYFRKLFSAPQCLLRVLGLSFFFQTSVERVVSPLCFLHSTGIGQWLFFHSFSRSVPRLLTFCYLPPEVFVPLPPFLKIIFLISSFPLCTSNLGLTRRSFGNLFNFQDITPLFHFLKALLHSPPLRFRFLRHHGTVLFLRLPIG